MFTKALRSLAVTTCLLGLVSVIPMLSHRAKAQAPGLPGFDGRFRGGGFMPAPPPPPGPTRAPINNGVGGGMGGGGMGGGMQGMGAARQPGSAGVA